MSVLFCMPLLVHTSSGGRPKFYSLYFSFIYLSCLIALFEAHFDHSRARDFASLTEEVEAFSSTEQDPTAWTEEDEFGIGDDEELIISRKSFEELRKGLPSLDRSTLGEILYEVSSVCPIEWERVMADLWLLFVLLAYEIERRGGGIEEGEEGVNKQGWRYYYACVLQDAIVYSHYRLYIDRHSCTICRQRKLHHSGRKQISVVQTRSV